ncbi:F-box protein At2g32560-like isoform X1 [Cynara cardunculus var. scolymus]|uniref:F-box domain, cyclin-like protein n=1 Tax=Cynara cardunculus var. scolymus TaxID=59895 RepID=A0A103YF74_CYNCS|nr:F-box protein At2g32560-like isoform X1 [Cynara cardunculus var. scolymus]XP_024973755.1 F-box protein At2g32560-like isoform X1 [Cynara cardunculus var. scolymus]KVI07979.1 F-box domain, cyclin-like protein [Cynara cardunculus var. scolymus]
MLFIFVTCFSFILFFRYSLPIKPLPPWACEMRLLSFYFWKDLSILFPSAKFLKKTLSINFNSYMFSTKTTKKINTLSRNTESMMTEGTGQEKVEEMSVLDLPNLALECILERLEPDGLCKMACVCTYLKDMCLSDHLWEGHMKKRWGRIIGSTAYKEWQLHIASRKESNCFLAGEKGRGLLMGYLSKLWPVMLVRSSSSNHGDSKKMKISSPQPPIDSIVSCYRALETGKFWFPAQIFNREDGHVGFMLSCYDADLSYDSHNDTFQARYPPHGRRAAAIETGVTWDRLRAPPVDTSPHDLHISDCLNDLRPRDHIEIQWRRNKQFPYGWWYGVVGHLEACDGNGSYCHCHESDAVVLEFNQYAPGSRWRHTMINRRHHREEGNEADGFYGGIRKLYSKDEISMWQQFWPAEILE